MPPESIFCRFFVILGSNRGPFCPSWASLILFLGVNESTASHTTVWRCPGEVLESFWSDFGMVLDLFFEGFGEEIQWLFDICLQCFVCLLVCLSCACASVCVCVSKVMFFSKTQTSQQIVYTSRFGSVKICIFHDFSTFVYMFGDTLGVLWGYFDIVCDIFGIVLQKSADFGRKKCFRICPGVIFPERR